METLGRRAVLITGAAGGIGAAVARRVASAGVHVAVTDLDPAGLNALVGEIGQAGGSASAYALDVTDPAAFGALMAAVESGGLVVAGAVACAGVIHTSLFVDLPDGIWRDTIEINLGGTFRTIQLVARRMIDRQVRGHIVALSSIAGRGGRPLAADYAASKAGVISVVRSAALALAPHGITVNAVCPGVIDTGMSAAIHRDRARLAGISSEESLARLVSTVPLGRIGTANDVAGLVAFLLSDDSSYITGQSINVCGGLQLD